MHAHMLDTRTHIFKWGSQQALIDSNITKENLYRKYQTCICVPTHTPIPHAHAQFSKVNSEICAIAHLYIFVSSRNVLVVTPAYKVWRVIIMCVMVMGTSTISANCKY